MFQILNIVTLTKNAPLRDLSLFKGALVYYLNK